MSNSKSTNDPFKSIVIVSKRVNRSCVVEDVEIEVGEFWVVVEFGFEEVEELVRSEGRSEVVVEEVC